MNINYQVMDITQRNSYGNYIPDYNKLLEGATCEEESEYIRKLMEKTDAQLNSSRAKNAGYTFNMVYIVRQACGHFEIFQSPQNAYYPLDKVLQQAEEHSKRNCTRCTCNWRGKWN